MGSLSHSVTDASRRDSASPTRRRVGHVRGQTLDVAGTAMNAVRRLLVRLGIGGSDDESNTVARPKPETTEAWAAAHSRDADPGDWGAEGGGLPPNYVKSYDEGRPRK